MASNKSSIPSHGVNLVRNISGSEFRESYQREVELGRLCPLPQVDLIPSVTIPPTFPPGIILGEHLFSTRELRNRLFGTDNISSVNTRKRVNATSMNSQDVGVTEGTDNGKKFDGRIHSLSKQKYGPYTCPKCSKIFPTSQHFAAHVQSHYKTETEDERKKRLQAKISKKSKNLHLHVSGEGITIASDPSKEKAKNDLAQQRTTDISVKVGVPGHFPNVPPGFEGHDYGSSSSGVKIIGPAVPPGFENYHYGSSFGVIKMKTEPSQI
ncbi:hypothetical protein K1719_026558 [Acacia pycnantha]|nr:hypothetical protein K1719_026558 [Acacia pycnantha]